MTSPATNPGEGPSCPPCPKKFYCLLSGGKDSVTTAHVLASQGRLAGCVFIDTSIRTPDVLPFVKELCYEQKWPLIVLPTPHQYEDLVRKYGFPGPQQHSLIMNYLKGRAIRRFRRLRFNAVLASGVRRKESRRRFQTVSENGWSQLEGAWVHAPLYDWSTKRVWAYTKEHGLPRSPTYKTLHISGDCLCGAYAQREEVYMVKTFYPDVAERIRVLEEAMQHSLVNGQPRRHGLLWGHGEGFGKEQTRIESFICNACAEGPAQG